MSHWTKELFEEHPQLFLAALEEHVAQAGSEVDVLLECLNNQSFKTQTILDLNCGIGRHSIELGKRGISVLGTDLSPYYIEIAKERAKKEGLEQRVRFRVADMRRIGSELLDEKPFDGIINLYTSFGFYDDKTNDDVLRQCYTLVRPEGFFAIEVMNRDWVINNFQKRGFSRYKNMLVLEDRHFDEKTSRMESVWSCLIQQDDKHFILEKQLTIDHRVYCLHELIEMFQRTGWEFKIVYPGFSKERSAITITKLKRLLFIARKSIGN